MSLSLVEGTDGLCVSHGELRPVRPGELTAHIKLSGSGAISALGHFGTKTRPRGRARHVTSDATDSDAAVSTRASVATRVTQSGRNFGRTSEHYVRKRPQCGEQDMARAIGPATGRVTTCHGDHGRHGAGHVQRRVTAPGHCGHGTGHGIHGAGHSDHGDGKRPGRPPEQWLSPGRAGGTKKQSITSLTRLYLTWRSSQCCAQYICYQSHVPISRLGSHSGILAQPDSVSESLPEHSLASACSALPALP
jgi:hypothetical protein